MRATDNFFDRKRDWSILKDRILAAYLKPYLAKISRRKEPVVIVDCFAGKGKFDDGKPGSPLLISGAISTFIKGKPNADISAKFIEKKYHADLARILRDAEHCTVLPGRYEECVPLLVNEIPANANVFLFVDPYGIKSLDFAHFEAFATCSTSSLELVVNLNTFGFLREGSRLLALRDFESDEASDVYERDVPDSPNSIERMNAIAAGPYWKDILTEYHKGTIDMHQAEKLFASAYVERLSRLFAYVTNIPVKRRRSHLPKYRLVYGTNHPDGLILMNDMMSRVWQDFVTQDRGGQTTLFREIDFPDVGQFEAYDLTEDILSLASERIELKELIVRLFVRYGITYSETELRTVIKKMESDRRLQICRDPELTPTGRRATSLNYAKYQIHIERS